MSLVAALEERGEAVSTAIAEGGTLGADDAVTWDRMLRSGREQRALWIASYEALMQSERAPSCTRCWLGASRRGGAG